MFGHNEAFNAKQYNLSTGEVLVREWSAKHGVTPEQLKESYVWRDIVNAATFQEMGALRCLRK